MAKISKLVLITAIAVIALGLGSLALAQENANAGVSGEEQVSSKDLEISDQNLLPDSPFYFLKEWGRGIQSFFAFGRIKKAELEQKFASERLLELKKLVEGGKVGSEVLEKATEKYEKTMEKIKSHADKIKENATDNEEVNKFLQKFTNQQVLHEKILQKLEEQVSDDVLEKIKQARNQHLEKFKEVMIKLEGNSGRIAEKIENALQDGSSDLETFDKINEKMPESVKEKLERVRQKIKDRKNNPCQTDADCPRISCGAPNCVEPEVKCVNGKCVIEDDIEDDAD